MSFAAQVAITVSILSDQSVVSSSLLVSAQLTWNFDQGEKNTRYYPHLLPMKTPKKGTGLKHQAGKMKHEGTKCT